MNNNDVKREIDRMTRHYSNTNNPVDFPQTKKPMEHIAKQRCTALVTALVGKVLVDDWWNRPNRAFDMLTPTDMWRKDYGRVYDYLMNNSGAGS